MREIRTSGSEGGAGRKPRSYLYRGGVGRFWLGLVFLGERGLA
jgi:hypothetical protein